MKFLFLITLITLSLSQYSIEGIVYDSKSKSPLTGVAVQLVGTSNGAVTADDGSFNIRLNATGDYILELTYIGYKTLRLNDIRVRGSRPEVRTIFLEEDQFSSDVVEVTGSYFRVKELTEVSKISLSQEEIRKFPGGFEDIVRTVSTLPGIAMNADQGRNDLIVRGGGPSENLFIVNNLEIPNINHFGAQGGGSGTLAFINLDFVENIEFSTGGFSARYGDKMSSVMELKLGEGRSDRVGGKATISATRYGAHIEGPSSDNGRFVFSARKSYLDIIFKAAGLPFVPVYRDYNFIYSHHFDNNDQLFLISLLADDDIKKFNDTEENRVFNAQVMNNEQVQFINGLNYRKLLSKGYLDLSLSVNLRDFNYSQEDIAEDIYFRSDTEELERILKLQHYYQLSDDASIRTGVTAKWSKTTSTINFEDTIVDQSGNRVAYQDIGIVDPSLASEKGVDKFGGFVEYDQNIGHFSFLAGIRYDKYNYINNTSYIAPRASMKYTFDPKTNIKLSAGRYFQAPSYVWTENPFNKNLNALKNDMVVLSFEHYLEDDVKFSFETYNKSYSDLPTGISPGDTDYLVLTNTGITFGGRENNFRSFGYSPYVSEGTGRAYGAELFLQKKYSNTPYYGQFSLSYNKSEYTAKNGITYPGQFDQRWILNISGGYKPNKNWEYSGRFRLYTGRPYTPVYVPSRNNGQIRNLPDEYLSKRLGTAHQLDLRVDRNYYYEKFTLIVYMDIQNIYNQKQPRIKQVDFYEDDYREERSVRILPSIGISFEF